MQRDAARCSEMQLCSRADLVKQGGRLESRHTKKHQRRGHRLSGGGREVVPPVACWAMGSGQPLQSHSVET
eukprot:scaffold17396_cov65-Phaeocystis_antarctica.AAC.10